MPRRLWYASRFRHQIAALECVLMSLTTHTECHLSGLFESNCSWRLDLYKEIILFLYTTERVFVRRCGGKLLFYHITYWNWTSDIFFAKSKWSLYSALSPGQRLTNNSGLQVVLQSVLHSCFLFNCYLFDHKFCLWMLLKTNLLFHLNKQIWGMSTVGVLQLYYRNAASWVNFRPEACLRKL